MADHPNQLDKSPYQYVWGNPIMLKDPDGNCPDCFGDWLVGMQIKFKNWMNSPSSESRYMTPLEKGGMTLTTNNPTLNGTTNNAPRTTSFGAEMFNIDFIYTLMSTIGTRNNGTKILSNDKVFQKIDAISEGADLMLEAESKAQDINGAVENHNKDKTPDTLIKTNNKFNPYKVIYLNPRTGKPDTTEGFNENGRDAQMRNYPETIEKY